MLDADDVERWLENAPAAAFWIGRLIGRSPEAIAVSDSLRDLAEVTPVPLPPNVWLAGRKAVRDRVERFLNGGPKSLAAEIGATGHGFEVLCAAVHEPGTGDRARVLPTPAAWDSASRAEAPLALLPRPGRARRWVVEGTHSWMNRFRALLVRWEKKDANYLGSLHLARAYITFKQAGLLG